MVGEPAVPADLKGLRCVSRRLAVDCQVREQLVCVLAGGQEDSQSRQSKRHGWRVNGTRYKEQQRNSPNSRMRVEDGNSREQRATREVAGRLTERTKCRRVE